MYKMAEFSDDVIFLCNLVPVFVMLTIKHVAIMWIKLLFKQLVKTGHIWRFLLQDHP